MKETIDVYWLLGVDGTLPEVHVFAKKTHTTLTTPIKSKSPILAERTYSTDVGEKRNFLNPNANQSLHHAKLISIIMQNNIVI